MKAFLTALLIVMAPSIRADEGKSLLLATIDEGIKAESQVKSALRSRDQARDEETKLIYWSAAREASDRVKSVYDHAIRLAQAEYGIESPTTQDPKAAAPTAPDGEWTAGLPAPRSVIFMQPNYRWIQGNDDARHFVSDVPEGAESDQIMALTDTDGRTIMLSFAMKMTAVTREPGILALTIHHENHHYRELITTGWDSHERMEIRAFAASAEAVDSFIPASNPALREALKESIAGVIAANTAALNAGDVHSPFPSKEQELAYREAFEKQESEEREYAALVQRVERLRRERRERQATAEKELRWLKFKVWTLYACSYINGVHEGDPEWGSPDLIRAREEMYRKYLRGGLVVMAKGEIDAGLRRNDLVHAGDLGRCHGQMVVMIRDLPGPVDEDWLMDRIEYERRGGRAGEILSGLLEYMRRSIADGTAGIVQSASAPFTADRSSGSDSRGADHGSRMPDIDKLPWRQLRGVSSRGW